MQHSQNPINNPDFRSKTDKAWASSYHSIPRTTSYTVVRDEVTSAYFDGVMLGECADDQYRKSEEAYPPNQRAWLLSTEADMSHWFHNEVSNVVLAAFKHTPTVLQASQAKPLTDESVPESVDDLYSVTCSTHRMPLVIGEMKRNIIRDAQWQAGIITSSDQQKLSRELRGYAIQIIPQASIISLCSGTLGSIDAHRCFASTAKTC